MSESELKGCGADSPKTYGRDPSSDKWVEADVPARCGEFLVKVPFEFDKNCLGNSVRNDYFAPTAGPSCINLVLLPILRFVATRVESVFERVQRR